MGGVAAHRRLEVVLRHHADMALEDVVKALVLVELDGTMVAEAERANRHRSIIGARNE